MADEEGYHSFEMTEEIARAIVEQDDGKYARVYDTCLMPKCGAPLWKHYAYCHKHARPQYGEYGSPDETFAQRYEEYAALCLEDDPKWEPPVVNKASVIRITRPGGEEEVARLEQAKAMVEAADVAAAIAEDQD